MVPLQPFLTFFELKVGLSLKNSNLLYVFRLLVLNNNYYFNKIMVNNALPI